VTTAAQLEAARALRRAVIALLAAHGHQWTERSRLMLDGRPGCLWFGEADSDEGYQPALIINFDDRHPALFGHDLDPRMGRC
jgi:hypothetical protein